MKNIWQFLSSNIPTSLRSLSMTSNLMKSRWKAKLSTEFIPLMRKNELSLRRKGKSIKHARLVKEKSSES